MPYPYEESERRTAQVLTDDVSIREPLPDLLQMLGFAARPFASAEDFLASDVLSDTQCRFAIFKAHAGPRPDPR
jgi:FixJ family two-component response regulator